MIRNRLSKFRRSLIAVTLASLALNAQAREVPNPLPRPDTSTPIIFGKPKLPVMMATVGFNGDQMSGNTLVVHAAQMAVGDAAKHPGFAGTVRTVDTRPFWRTVAQSPGDEGHHYNRNAETYTLVGDALARGMIELLEKPSK